MKQGIIILYREIILEYLNSYHFQCYIEKAMTSYNNACACNRLCPLGYFIVYRLSSSTQPAADFPHSKSNLLRGNLTGRCELRAGLTPARPWLEVLMASLYLWCLNKQKLKILVLLPGAGITVANTAALKETRLKVWDPD